MADIGSIAASLGTDDGQGVPARQLTAGAARTGTSGLDAATRSGERAQLQKLAEEFESMLLLQVMRQVRQTVTSFGDDQGSGALGGDMGTMFDTVDAELSRYLGQAGGFGLSRSLTQSLGSVGTSSAATSRAKAEASTYTRTASPSANVVTAAGAASYVATAAIGRPAETVPEAAIPEAGSGSTVDTVASDRPASLVNPAAESFLTAHVTSSFGWRSDPIQHVRRFHGGVDLRAAYGQAVPVAADGRVVSAGPDGEYGLSVLVDHGNGIQTRYAHLSSIDVAAGNVVTDGTPIGRAGQSGRATGPHLHLEVLRNGQRVDPREWLQSDEFKKVAARAD